MENASTAGHWAFFESTIEAPEAVKIVCPRKTIVDVGCQWGCISARVAREYPECDVIGIDSHHFAISKTIEKYESQSNLSFICGDPQDLAVLLYKKVDLILCNSLLHWFPFQDQKKILKQMTQILKKGGNAQISMAGNYTIDYQQPFNRIWPAIAQKYDIDPFEQQVFGRTIQSFRTLAQSAGFTVKSLEIKDFCQTFEGNGAFKAWVRKWVALLPIISTITDRKRRTSIIEEIVDAYTLYTIKGERGKIEYESSLLLAWLEKGRPDEQKVAKNIDKKR
jgi:ubiquinone/menaquinone biosynthesis C-methylase UbiE